MSPAHRYRWALLLAAAAAWIAATAWSSAADADTGVTIRGTVVNEDGDGIPDVSVFASGQDLGTGGWTDDNGRYELSGLVDGASYRITFWDSEGEYVSQYYDGALSWSEATPVRAPADQIDAVLMRGVSITGTVTDEAGVGVAGIEVWADSEDLEWGQSAVADDNGRYELSGLVDGASYRITFWDPEGRYPRQYYDGVLSWSEATLVMAPAVDLETVLTVGETIRGTVTAEGQPLEGISVRASRVDAFDGEQQATTGADGTYVITGMVAGADYRVRFFDPSGNHVAEYYDAEALWHRAARVAAPAEDIDAQLRPAATIRGTVTNEGGAPIADIEVRAQADGGGGALFARTDYDGAYVLDGVDPDLGYHISFRDPSRRYVEEYYDGVYFLDAATPVTRQVGDPGDPVDAVLSSAAVVSGTVTVPEGFAPDEVGVWARSEDTDFSVGTSVRADGTYELRGLLDGAEYTLRFAHQQRRLVTESRAAVAPESDVNVELRVVAIEGVVTTRLDQVPLAGLELELREWDSGQLVHELTTDDQGRFRIDEGLLEFRFYELSVSDPQDRILEPEPRSILAPDEEFSWQLVEESKISLAVTPESSVTGQAIQIQAEVSGTVTTPRSGTVRVAIDGEQRSSLTLQSNQDLVFVTPLDAGSYEIEVSYTGGNTHGVASATQTYEVVSADTSLDLSIDPAGPVDVGDTTEVEVVLQVEPPGSGVSSGPVTVRIDDGEDKQLLEVALEDDGASRRSGVSELPELTPGPYAIDASYAGDARFNPSMAPPVEFFVRWPTEVEVELPAEPVVTGQRFEVAAAVTSADPAQAPDGVVEFVLDGVSAGTSPLDEDGTARFEVAIDAAGPVLIETVYEGTDRYTSSQAASEQQIDPASTEVDLAVDPGVIDVGESARLEARVQPVAPGGGNPEGMVRFLDGDLLLAEVQLADGVAVAEPEFAAPGARTVIAEYVGGDDHLPADGDAQVSVRWPTSVGVVTQPSSSSVGGSVSLRASVTAPAIDGRRPDQVDGQVEFRLLGQATDVLLDTIELSDGVATTSWVPEDQGEYQIEASYLGAGLTAPSRAEVTHVVSPAATEPDERVEVSVVDAGSSAPLSGVRVLILTSAGQEYESQTDADGVASFEGVPNGAHTAYALRSGYQANLASIDVDRGVGSTSIQLTAGQSVATAIEVNRLTYEEILAAGIDPDDPANQQVIEFEVEIRLADGSRTRLRGRAGGSGSGSGWTSFIRYSGTSQIRVSGSVRWVNDQPIMQWLVLPGEARFLKEFFSVEVIVQNLASPGIRLEQVEAELELPEGLALAPTPDEQVLKVGLEDVDGGDSATASWIIRGDEEGEYDLSARVDALLWPFNESFEIIAETDEPFVVYGASALGFSIVADDEAVRGSPYRVDIAVENVVDIPIYNVALDLVDASGDSYILQPLQQLEYRASTLLPGERLVAELRLVPLRGGTIDSEESVSVRASGAEAEEFEISVRDAEDAPTVETFSLGENIGLEFEEIEGASEYLVFTTTSRATPFAQQPASSRQVSDGRIVLDDDAVEVGEPLLVAISAVIDGTPIMVHQLTDAVTNGEVESMTGSVNVTGDRGDRTCGGFTFYELEFSDSFFGLDTVRWTVGERENEVEVSGNEWTRGSLLLTASMIGEDGITVSAQARNADGQWGREVSRSFSTDCAVRPVTVLAAGLNSSIEGHDRGLYAKTWGSRDETMSVIERLSDRGYRYGSNWLSTARTIIEYSYESEGRTARGVAFDDGPAFIPNTYSGNRTYIELPRLLTSDVSVSAEFYVDALIAYDHWWSRDRPQRLEYHLVGHSLGGAQVLQIGYELARRADTCSGTYQDRDGAFSDYPCGRLQDLVGSITTVNGALHPQSVINDFEGLGCSTGLPGPSIADIRRVVLTPKVAAWVEVASQVDLFRERRDQARAIEDLAERGIRISTVTNAYDTCLSEASTITTADHFRVMTATYSVREFDTGIFGPTGKSGHGALLRPGVPTEGSSIYPLDRLLNTRIPRPNNFNSAPYDGPSTRAMSGADARTGPLARQGTREAPLASGSEPMLTGRVVTVEGAAESAGQVAAYGEDGTLVELADIVAGGGFVFETLPAGSYRLFASPDSMTSGGSWLGGSSFETATPVVLGTSSIDLGDVPTVVTHQLQVQVVDASGDRVEIAGATLVDDDDYRREALPTLDGGVITFADVPAGDYLLTVAGPFSAPSSVPVRLPDDTDVSVEVGPAGGVRLAVSDEAGQPVFGLMATLLVDGEPFEVRSSGPDGVLRFGAVPPGEHEVRLLGNAFTGEEIDRPDVSVTSVVDEVFDVAINIDQVGQGSDDGQAPGGDGSPPADGSPGVPPADEDGSPGAPAPGDAPSSDDEESPAAPPGDGDEGTAPSPGDEDSASPPPGDGDAATAPPADDGPAGEPGGSGEVTAPDDDPDVLGVIADATSLAHVCEEGSFSAEVFEDVPAGNVHLTAIDCGAAWELIAGLGDGRFAPANDVTRAQLGSFVARLLSRADALPEGPVPDAFSDDDGSVHEDSLNLLAAADIMRGYPDGTVRPNDAITREQATAMLVRATEHVLGRILPEGPNTFEDVAGTHARDINAAAALGLVTGLDERTFDPAGWIRRDQMASMLVRTLNILAATQEVELADPRQP